MEKMTIVFEDNALRVENILSFGEISAEGFWYEQTQDEFVYLVNGSARLEFLEAVFVELLIGDSFLIRKNTKHRVSFTSIDCEWICVFAKANA